MLKKSVQQGRSEFRPSTYPLGYVEGLNDARTKLAGFFSFLLQHEEEVKIIDVRAGRTGDDELLECLQRGVGVVALQRALEIH